MKTLNKLLIAAVFVVAVSAFVPAARADDGDWATQVTIVHPLQIGDMVLTPGSYIFRLADIWAPDVVMIYNVNSQHWDGIVMGTPVYREKSTEKTSLILKKEPKGAPEAIHYWYYPDSNYGIRFATPHVNTAAIPANTTRNAG